jgi:hypothetical protein
MGFERTSVERAVRPPPRHRPSCAAEPGSLAVEAVAAYRRDRKRADELFRKTFAAAPAELPVYCCQYKIHTYRGNLDDALAMAESSLKEGARRAGWPLDWRERQPQPEALDAPAV